jgi:hypothetical protein
LEATLRELTSMQLQQQYSARSDRQRQRILQRQIGRLKRVVMSDPNSSVRISMSEEEARIVSKALGR